MLISDNGQFNNLENKSFDFRMFINILLSSSLVFFVHLYLISLATLFFGFQITKFQFWASIFVTFAYTILVSKVILEVDFFWYASKVFGTFLILFVLCVSISGFLIDMSYDGQGYHSAGTMALNKGWNPIHEDIFEKTEIKSENKLWIESYPHANNIFTLNLFKIDGNIETGKGLSIFFIIISGLIGFVALLKTGLNKWQGAILIIITVLNPINVLQIFTFGLDTQFYSMLVIFLSIVVLICNKQFLILNLINLSAVTVLLINNKLTSIAYLFIFCVAICLHLLFRRNYRLFLQMSLTLLISTFLAILVFGYQPFVTNYLNHRSIFYPIYISQESDDKQYDFSENRPSNFVNENQLTLFIKSIFFKTNGQFRPPLDIAEYKIPFTYSKSELESFIYLGPKVGAFGVLFSGIVVIVLVLFLLMIIYRKRYSGTRLIFFTLSMLILVILISSIVNPLNSSYRYIPQFWLCIPLIMWLSWYFKSKIIIVLNAYLLIVICVNSLMILDNTASFNISKSVELSHYLRKLSILSQENQVLVNFAQAEGNEFLLDRYDVKYIADIGQSRDFTCPTGLEKKSLLKNIGNSTALVCLDINDISELYKF